MEYYSDSQMETDLDDYDTYGAADGTTARKGGEADDQYSGTSAGTNATRSEAFSSPSQFVPARTPTISVAFPSTFALNGVQPDVVIASSDQVLFFAHRSRLAATSLNGFNGQLTTQQYSNEKSQLILRLPEDSTLLNVVLHTIYDRSCIAFRPQLGTLLTALWSLKTYGVPLELFVAPGRPLYNHILMEAPRLPLEVYAVAAQHKLEPLAVASSAYLLSLQLPTLSDDMTDRMGTRYFKRLIFLHLRRENVLKRLLFQIPALHENTPTCGLVEQKELARAWGSAAANLLWQVRPDFPVGILRSTMGALDQHLTCPECQKSLSIKVRQIVLEWSETKATI